MVLEPVVACYRGTVKRLHFRCDAAFANPDIYEFHEAEGAGYTIRLPANRVLQDKIGYLLKRPVGRPPQEVRRYYTSFSYQAQSWKKARRVVAKVEWHLGERLNSNTGRKRGVIEYASGCRHRARTPGFGPVSVIARSEPGGAQSCRAGSSN